jgi:hypothetical protein
VPAPGPSESFNARGIAFGFASMRRHFSQSDKPRKLPGKIRNRFHVDPGQHFPDLACDSFHDHTRPVTRISHRVRNRRRGRRIPGRCARPPRHLVGDGVCRFYVPCE